MDPSGVAINNKLLKEYAFIYKSSKKSLNKKELKSIYRKKLLDSLKNISKYPDLVNIEDVKCDDPLLFNKIKGIFKSVPVVRRWKHKHLFPLNYKKKDYNIPPSIVDTGLDLLRYNLIQEKKSESDKEKFMNKIFPKIGKVRLNPEKLYNSFSTPQNMGLFEYGEVFDFSWETEKKRFLPGILTPELRTALGMNEFSPPPWIFKMQKIGPPSFYYPIPGVNAEIPPGCFYGYEPNHWGRPSFIPKEKEEYIYNLENQYTALKEKERLGANKEIIKDEKIIKDDVIREKIEEKIIKEKIEDDMIKEKIEEKVIEDEQVVEKIDEIKEIKKDKKKKKDPKSKLRSKF